MSKKGIRRHALLFAHYLACARGWGAIAFDKKVKQPAKLANLKRASQHLQILLRLGYKK